MKAFCALVWNVAPRPLIFPSVAHATPPGAVAPPGPANTMARKAPARVRAPSAHENRVFFTEPNHPFWNRWPTRGPTWAAEFEAVVEHRLLRVGFGPVNS